MGALVGDFLSREGFEAAALLRVHHSMVEQLDLSSQIRFAVIPLVGTPIEQLLASLFLLNLLFRKFVFHALVESLRLCLMPRLPTVDSLMLEYF